MNHALCYTDKLRASSQKQQSTWRLSLYLDALFRLWEEHSSLLLLYHVCLDEKQQIIIFNVFGLIRPGIERTTFHTQACLWQIITTPRRSI